MNISTRWLMQALGWAVTIIILPAAIWCFTALMDTRDQALRTEAEVRAIKDFFLPEIASLRKTNDDLRRELANHEQGGP